MKKVYIAMIERSEIGKAIFGSNTRMVYFTSRKEAQKFINRLDVYEEGHIDIENVTEDIYAKIDFCA